MTDTRTDATDVPADPAPDAAASTAAGPGAADAAGADGIHRFHDEERRPHHDPRDAQAMLNSEIFGNCVIAPFTRDYVRAAAHERIG